MANKYIVKLRRGTKEQWQTYEQQTNHIKPYAGELVVEYDDVYLNAASYESGVTYYIASNNTYTEATTQPTSSTFSNGTYYKKKTIPRLKIGDGTHEFSQLEYMSVDSFILPTKSTITLTGGLGANAWSQDTYGNGDTIPSGYSVGDPIPNTYKQVVTVNNAIVTEHSKINLQPSPEQLCEFHEKDVAFTTVNENGVITVYAVGVCPTNNHTLQVTVTEVDTND